VAETLETGRVAAESGRQSPRLVGALPARRGAARGLPAAIADALEERRLAILVPFAMIAGVVVAALLEQEPQPLALGGGALAAAALLVASLRAATRLRLATLLVAFWLGLCLLPLHGALFGTPMLQRAAYGEYQARVDEVLSETESETRLILSAITPLAGARALPVRRARVLVKAGPDLAPGDIVAGPFRFAPVPGPVYPGGYDTQFHAFFDGLGAYGNSTRPPRLVASGSAWAPEHVIDAIRRGIALRIDAVLAQPTAGVARAIINGDQSAVTDAARETMATAGIAHVLSVSGLHLTIVAGGVFWVVRLLLAGFAATTSRVSIKQLAALAGSAAALFYFAISGGNVAAFRSTLMILLVFGAVLAGRRALTMRNVAIAAIVVVASDPASIFRPSFQLSFAAVVALVGAYENLRSARAREASLVAHAWGYGKGVVITSLVAGAATLLFSIYHFQQTSPLGVLGNLLSLPLVGFIMMPAALLSVLAMPFGLDAPFTLAMGWSIERMLEMGALVAGWSEHLRASPLLTPLALVIGLGALGWFAFLREARWRLAGPLAALPLVLAFAVDRPPDVLVADTTQAIAIRGEAGLELAAGRARSFALDVWRETYAEPIATAAAQGCDSLACIGASSAGFTYAIIRDPGGFAEECGEVDLILTRLRAPAYCMAPTVIDADDLAQGGVHWLRWRGEGFEIRPSITGLARPWRLTP
jgi:competence protein ComEC